ncbi:helix-turn-helix domain-containing protein [Candidatus Methylomirabilis sp.]|uniref:helix-turn-helix domain-containing protein n=1 Tax=Candidatus Methylomirabilis sp. TaxID=2032687 RepID=UPI00307647BF
MKKTMPTAVPQESDTVEWKKSLGEWKEIVETCAALASADGGRIWIGVAPDGQTVGVQVGKGTMEGLANKIAQNTSPRQTPVISRVARGEKTLIIVNVTESPAKPVYAFDRPYRRSGCTNQRLSTEEAMHLFMASRAITWDYTLPDDASMADIDPAVVRRFLKVAKAERQWDVSSDTPAEQVLRQLGLIRDNRLTVAAVLLFGRNPQRLMTQAMLRCARFKGTNEVHFLDMKVIQGNIIEQVEEAMAFVRRNTRMAVEIKGLQREENWEYPLDALREAIVNAVCHRDYASSANVQVRIFDDRLDVWNPGGLPEGMTVNDLRGVHESKPRNRLVANAFFLIKYVEQFGTGTGRIIADCLGHGLPEPEFESRPDRFRAIFRPRAITESTKTDAELNDRQRSALAYIQKHGHITRSRYEAELGVPMRTANRELKDLVVKGVVLRHGAGRSFRYVLAGVGGKQVASNGKQVASDRKVPS